MEKPTANASLTWVKDNHTYKASPEMRIEGYPVELNWPGNGSFVFTATEGGTFPVQEAKTLEEEA